MIAIAALAVEKNAPLLTGDSEFERIIDKIQIVWIKKKAKKM